MFLYDLLILLVFVWLGRKLFQHFGLPPLFGEVFAGVLVGPLVFGMVEETEAIKTLAELGIFMLMFHSGLESDPKDLFKASKNAVFIALGGVVLSILGGFFTAYYFGYPPQTALFIGMSLSITAVAISARLFKDTKLTKTRVAHTVMTAAVMTEIVVLVFLSTLLDVHETGTFMLKAVALDLLIFLAYFGIVFYVGHHYFKYLYKIVYKGNKGFTFSIIVALTLAVIAELIGLHFIIGAFLAGLFLHQEIFEEEVFNKIEDRTFGLSYSFLAPVFFASLAFHLDFSVLSTLPVFFTIILLVALVAKVFGSGFTAYWLGMSKVESFTVGLAMNSRGAVELIIATIGLQAGIIDADVFSVLVLVSFATTLISILGVKPLAKKIKAEQARVGK
ncbi:MAG: Kef-type K+ transport system membrane component KefB [Oceanicoccus sp.]|jgi:Kef-type K+ transport system membrane component KefB